MNKDKVIVFVFLMFLFGCETSQENSCNSNLYTKELKNYKMFNSVSTIDSLLFKKEGNSSMLLYNKAILLLSSNFNKDGLDILLELDSISPCFIENKYLIGLNYYDNEKLDMAFKYFIDVIRMDSTYSDAYNSLGLVYKKSNNKEKAKEYFTKAITLNPKNVIAIEQIALIYSEVGDVDSTLYYFDKAYKINGNTNTSITFDYGYFYFKNKNFKKALALFKESLEGGYENQGKLFYYMGVSEIKLNNNVKGCEYIERALNKGFPIKEYTDACL